MNNRRLLKIALYISFCFIALCLLSPFLALIINAFSAKMPQEIIINEAIESLITSLHLIFWVVIFASLIGISAAFITTFVEFEGKWLINILLILPLTLPPYLITMGWNDVMDSFGIVQTLYRKLFGFTLRSEYSFLNPKSFMGAVFYFTISLYPYVYLSMKTYFQSENARLLQAGLTLGATKEQALRRITFKRSLPALLGGISLVAFETLNDVGVAKLCGVLTTPSLIMSIWQEQNDLKTASLLSSLLFLIILGIVFTQIKFSSLKQEKTNVSSRVTPLYSPSKLARRVIALSLTLPFILGALVPLSYFLSQSFNGKAVAYFTLSPILNSIFYAVSVAMLASLIAVFLLFMQKRLKLKQGFTGLLTLGYALPASILAIGCISALLFIENSLFHTKTYLLYGSSFALIIALTIRFLLQSFSQCEKAQMKRSPHLTYAARTLGASPLKAFMRIDLPQLKPALLTGALVVFVEALKELPLTLLLRPIGKETIALHLFQNAERGDVSVVAPYALLLSLICISAALLLNQTTHKS